MLANVPFWLHCNRCGCLACEKGGDASKFSITSCGHVLCDECLSEPAQLCFVCRHSPLRTQAIDGTMSSQMKRLFMPPEMLLQDVWKKARSVMAFQQMHFAISTELLQEKMNASNNHLGDQSETAQNTNELRKEVDSLKSSVANIQRALNRTADISFACVGRQNECCGSGREDVCGIVEMGNLSSLNFSFATDGNATTRSVIDDATFDTSAMEAVLNMHNEKRQNIPSANTMAIVTAKGSEPTVDERQFIHDGNGVHSGSVEDKRRSVPTDVTRKLDGDLNNDMANSPSESAEKTDQNFIFSTGSQLTVANRNDMSHSCSQIRVAFPNTERNVPDSGFDREVEASENTRAIPHWTGASAYSVSEVHPISSAHAQEVSWHSQTSSKEWVRGAKNHASGSLERQSRYAGSVELSSQPFSQSSSKAASTSVPHERATASNTLRCFIPHALPRKCVVQVSQTADVPSGSCLMNNRNANIRNDRTVSVAEGGLAKQPIHNGSHVMSTYEQQPTCGHAVQEQHDFKRNHASRVQHKRRIPSFDMSKTCADSKIRTRTDTSAELDKSTYNEVPAATMAPNSNESLPVNARRHIPGVASTVNRSGTGDMGRLKWKPLPKFRKTVKFRDRLNVVSDAPKY